MSEEVTAEDSLGMLMDAFQMDNALDAADNLHGALIDLRRMEEAADPVCIRTVERVLDQLHKMKAILKREWPPSG